MKKFIFTILLSCMFISTVNAADYLCKEAKIFHTEICNYTTDSGCRKDGYNQGDTITYGYDFAGPGKAYDCDVNGDGVYDAETERFYYVSEYYETSTKNFDSNYATLVYYKNITDEEINYNDGTYAEYWNLNSTAQYSAPYTAVAYLSKYVNKTTWPNVSLYKKNRKITGYYASDIFFNSFPYSQLTNARLLTFAELQRGHCIEFTDEEDKSTAYLDNCEFLFENTGYGGNVFPTKYYWLETLNPDGDYAATIGPGAMDYDEIIGNIAGVRPVIDVAINDLEDLDKETENNKTIWKQFVEKYTNKVNTIEGYNSKINSTMTTLTIKSTNTDIDIITEFNHASGILTYTSKNLQSGSAEDINEAGLDSLLNLSAIQALAELKGYDTENFTNWMNSVDDETMSKYTIENAGIEYTTNTISVEEGNSSMTITYPKTFKLDLVNGIKAYDPNVDYSDDNNTEEPENPTEDKEVDEYPNLPENPQTGAFVSIVAVLGAIGIIVGIVYYIKKKNMFHKI